MAASLLMEGMSSDLPEHNGQPGVELVPLDTTMQAKPSYASSISLSSPEQSEADSDFATYGAGTVTGHSRPGSSDGEASDDSTYGAAHRYCVHQSCLLICIQPSQLTADSLPVFLVCQAGQGCFTAISNLQFIHH